MRIPSTRQLFLLALLGCIGLLAFALYLEHVVGLVPCPLCHVQRVAVLMFAVVCLLATVHNPALCGQRVYAVLAALAASFGIATAEINWTLLGFNLAELSMVSFIIMLVFSIFLLFRKHA